jgi:hypothetical protein
MVHPTPTKVLLTTTLRPLVAQLSGSLAHGVRLLDQFLHDEPTPQQKQHLQSTRRNTLPVKLVDGSRLMCHKHLACAPVEQMEIGQTSSGPDLVLHHPPEAFDRVQVVTTMGR